jgi:hypothetical protein
VKGLPTFAVIAVVAVACAPKRQCVLPPIAAEARGPAFLWKVHKGGDALWLYGTIHDAGMEAVPLVAREALEKSVRLVSELGDQTPDRDRFRELARIASGPGIDQQLPASDWYDLRDALLGRIREDDLRRAKPWYAMTLLTTHMTPSPGPSMDVLLAKRAQELAMPVEHLETWDEQLTALDHAVGIADLQEAVRARKTMTCDLARLRSSYEAGDIATMQALLVVPRTEATMLTARNLKWMPKLETYFAQGGAFVAVGLGHLLGEHGLPAMFQRAGYTVERTASR